MKIFRTTFCVLTAALLWNMTASFAARATEEAGKITVRVVTCRISKKTLEKLGFDWMIRPLNDPIEVGGPSKKALPPEKTTRLQGSLLPAQFNMMQRALMQEGIELKILPPVHVNDEVRVDSPFADARRGFTLALKTEEGTTTDVSVKGSVPPQDISVADNDLLYAQPAPEVEGYELYFVSVAARSAPSDWSKSKAPQIEIEAQVIEMPEASYEKHQAELEDAVRTGDMKRLAIFEKEGLEMLSMPKITMRTGQRGVIQLVREFRYPTEYDLEVSGALTPAAFETANLGIELPITAKLVDGNIQVDGQLIVRAFEGFTQSERGTFAPAFQATEANFLRTLKDGQAVGFWLPGARTLRKSLDGLLARVSSSVNNKVTGASSKEKVRSKLGFIVTAKLVSFREIPLSARLSVKAYDITKTALGVSSLKSDDDYNGRAVYILGAVLDEKDAVPATAIELPVTEDSQGRFRFHTPKEAQCIVKRAAGASDFDISIWPKNNDKIGDLRMVTSSVALYDGSKALMLSSNRKAGNAEAILIVTQKNPGESHGRK